MPYRRLPNTDNARIRALKTAIEKRRVYYGGEAFTISMQQLEQLLRNFEASQIHYKKSLETQVKSNLKFQKLIRDARLYVSHFIQVLNLCVMRNEFKDTIKNLYKLPLENYAVPDLISNEALLEVGANIIEGEHARLLESGIPIYNPSIARVNVAYSLFKDAFVAQKQYQSTTAHHLEELTAQRGAIDETMKKLWNQIEAHFEDLPEGERLKKCKEFGVIYYYRKGEKETIEGSENN